MRQTPEAAFERIADPTAAAAILEVIGPARPPRVAPAEVAVGEGAGWIMAAFLQGGPGRFNDATFGAFYAAREETTAIVETQFHYARFLRDAREEHTLFGARVLLADIVAAPVDIRSRASSLPELYDPDPGRYGPAQRWAASQRAAGADGVLYDSVRRAGGQCVALFRPRLVRACRAGDRLAYEWDGAQFVAVYTLTPREVP